MAVSLEYYKKLIPKCPIQAVPARQHLPYIITMVREIYLFEFQACLRVCKCYGNYILLLDLWPIVLLKQFTVLSRFQQFNLVFKTKDNCRGHHSRNYGLHMIFCTLITCRLLLSHMYCKSKNLDYICLNLLSICSRVSNKL